jgi:multidrug transporter EmrE-like cation transporter
MGKLGLLVGSILLGSIGQILLKQGANQLKGSKLSLSTIPQLCIDVYSNVPILSGIALYGISSFLWILALTKTELSFAYPMVAFSYVIVSCASWIIFKDHLSLSRLLSLGIIAVGVILLSRS